MERYAIVGTAPSYAMTPWQDTGLFIASLNDAYQLPEIKRADEWVDLHPLNHFFYPETDATGKRANVFAHQVPYGYYCRPAKHLDWLASQPFPVWLHPDHATQHPASAAWPTARAFPKAAIEAHFGMYFTSTPQWMLGHAVLRGAKEIHIYGIHLATESEYIEQRPGFEFLIGRVLGRGKQTVTVKNGLRRYETPDGMVVLPEASPVLSSTHQYAFQPSPRRKLEPLKWELHKAQIKYSRTVDALKHAKWWSPYVTANMPNETGDLVPTRLKTSTLRDDLWTYEALVADCQDQLARAQAGL